MIYMKALPNRIILHCSATPDFLHINKKFDSIGASEINAWHMERGWEKIGYHFVIRRTGKIETGRYVDQFNVEIGAHTLGCNNDSIGICLVGTRLFTDEQFEALKTLQKNLRMVFGIGKNAWHGHCEFAKKECPGVSMEFIKNLFEI